MSINRHGRQEQSRDRTSPTASVSQPRGVPPRDALLKIKDVAEIIGVVPKTVRAWINSGKLKTVRDGRIIRITPDALDNYINEHMR